MSAHTVTALRQLVLYSGGFIITHQLANRTTGIDNSLIALDENASKISQSTSDISNYFLGKLLVNQGSLWASGLFQVLSLPNSIECI